jgi:hypothetical protein
MGWTPSTADALAAILAAFQASPGLSSAHVFDAAVVSATSSRLAVAVGYTGDEETPEAEGTIDQEGLAAQPDREHGVIRCLAAALNGTGDGETARASALGLLAACGDAIAADRKLGGAVMRAWVGTWALKLIQDERGARASIVLEIEYDAYTRR